MYGLQPDLTRSGHAGTSDPGEDDRTDLNTRCIQPFLSDVTSTKTTLTANSESPYDGQGEPWSIPINMIVSQMIKLGGKPMQVGAGARYWAESADAGPDGWGLRLQLTLLFPT